MGLDVDQEICSFSYLMMLLIEEERFPLTAVAQGITFLDAGSSSSMPPSRKEKKTLSSIIVHTCSTDALLRLLAPIDTTPSSLLRVNQLLGPYEALSSIIREQAETILLYLLEESSVNRWPCQAKFLLQDQDQGEPKLRTFASTLDAQQ